MTATNTFTDTRDLKIPSVEKNRVVIRCLDLVKRYGDVTAINGLHLEIIAGECFGLLGPNGAGKTTTIEIIQGLTRPDSGEVTLLGCRWGSGRDQALRSRIGAQLQETKLAEKLTVLETLRLFRSFYQKGRDVEDAVKMVELEEKRNARVGKLSGGQKQRLAIACALVGSPEAMFLDEPTTGLDPQARLKVWSVIEEFKSFGGTVLLTTHYMDEASRLCDRVAVVDHGKIIALGTPAELVLSLGGDQIIQFAADKKIDESLLSSLPGVRTIRVQDEENFLTVFDAGAALHALLSEIERQEARIITLSTHQATLEDVFVHLTGRMLRDA